VTTATRRPARPGPRPAGPGGPGPSRPLAVTGALAASVVTLTGLGALTPLVLAGWIAAPHTSLGLPGVLRTTAVLWLAAHHVGFAIARAGRFGMLPLGLVLLPGALLWRAGRWVVRAGRLTRLAEAGYAALALAVPYAALSGALALASRSGPAAPSAPEAVLAGFLLAAAAGGLGGARAIAPWATVASLLPARLRAVVLGSTGTLAVLAAGGAVAAAVSLAVHLRQFQALSTALRPGLVGTGLLLLAQLAYLPNAVVWAVCYCLGPGFAVGQGTVVAPTGSALGPLPGFPMLAALPAGGGAAPGWASVAFLALPYAAGGFGGLVLARSAPVLAIETAPVLGLGSGVVAGCVTGALAAFSGGPLGSGRLSTVGPSGWQAGLIAALETGVAAAIVAGVANWRRLRQDPALLAALSKPAASRAPGAGSRAGAGSPAGAGAAGDPMTGQHRIFADPWRDSEQSDKRGPVLPGPSSLPGRGPAWP
jgi:hypothetical protein